jgi:hypothetical protein
MQKDNRLCLGIILFKPSTEELDSVIKLSEKYDVYVYVNSKLNYEDELRLKSRVFFIYFSEINMGISKAMNHLFKKSYKNGFKYFLCLDQDTIISNMNITDIQNEILEIEFKFQDYNFLGFTLNVLSNKYNFQDFIINSGTIFNLHLLKKMSYFNEEYFVDLVDYEISARAHMANLKFINIQNNGFFDHISNQADTIHNIFGLKVRSRRYDITRLRETMKAYKRLMFFCIKNIEIFFFLKLLRSLIIYKVYRFLALLPVEAKK